MMKVQEYINMTSALIVFVGGIAIVFFYPGHLERHYRVLIGVFVSFYFLIRVGQTVISIQRGRRSKKGDLKYLIDEEDEKIEGPKTP
jgi:hypothetical protein